MSPHNLTDHRALLAERGPPARDEKSPPRWGATVRNLHAPIRHLLGRNRDRLSYDHNGIDRRPADVHGEVRRDLLA